MLINYIVEEISRPEKAAMVVYSVPNTADISIPKL
jgi:hypothetical protein